MEKTEERLKQATEKFNQASHSGEESERFEITHTHTSFRFEILIN